MSKTPEDMSSSNEQSTQEMNSNQSNFPCLWEALGAAQSLLPSGGEAKSSPNPYGGELAAGYLLGLMSVYSETLYGATWIDGVEIELWDYFSQNTDTALLDPMIREEYEAIKSAAHHADGWWSHDGERYRFYPREEWVARTGQSWPINEQVAS